MVPLCIYLALSYVLPPASCFQPTFAKHLLLADVATHREQVGRGGQVMLSPFLSHGLLRREPELELRAPLH